MSQAALYKTKDHLSAYVDAVVSGAESEHIITKHGVAVAKLIPMSRPQDASKRFGFFADDPQFNFDEEAFDAMDAEIAEDFGMWT